MDDKLKEVLHKVELLCEQNPEFAAALKEKLGTNAILAASSDSQLDEIYEYCIERVVRKQAEEYYASFPIEDIREQLIHDYCRMERFRRSDNFGDFCLAAYQQVECICRSLVDNSDLQTTTQKLWAHPAYVYVGEWKDGAFAPALNIAVNVRTKDNYRVADLVFPGKDNIDNTPLANKKYNTPLSGQSAADLIRIIIYFVCYQATLKKAEYDYYVEFCKTIGQQLYQCRNLNHRGSGQTEWQKEIVDEVLSHQSMYYFKFIGELVHFVDTVSKGILALPQIAVSIKEMPDKEMKIQLQGLNVKGKIDLPDDGKKRFK